MPKQEPYFTVGELASRSGVAPSALRFYESLGLIASSRTSGNQRRYARPMLRRVSLVRVARELGLTLHEIGALLAALPLESLIVDDDWERLAAAWQAALDARIAGLTRLRESLSSCIGCGCLSLQRCALFNADDRAARTGSGPRYLLGESADDDQL